MKLKHITATFEHTLALAMLWVPPPPPGHKNLMSETDNEFFLNVFLLVGVWEENQKNIHVVIIITGQGVPQNIGPSSISFISQH